MNLTSSMRLISGSPDHRDEAMVGDDRELQLLAQVASRKPAAFRELYFLYHPRVARLVGCLMRRDERAEEVINDTMRAVWLNAAHFKGTLRVSTWIMSIAYLRARRSRYIVKLLAPRRNAIAARSPLTVGDASCTSDRRESMSDALERLPPEQRVVLELTQLGHSCEEIAAIMRCPANTVKSRMRRTREKLTAMLPCAQSGTH